MLKIRLAVQHFRRESAPPSGALKIAPMPPATPASIKMRRSRTDNFNNDPNVDPKPAPICAIGPSFPADPPLPIVKSTRYL